MKYKVGDIVYFNHYGMYKAVVIFAYEFTHKDPYDEKENHQVYLLEKTTGGDRFDRFELFPEEKLFKSKAECINSIDKTK